MKATLRHIHLCRTANMSWRTCVVVKQIQSNHVSAKVKLICRWLYISFFKQCVHRAQDKGKQLSFVWGYFNTRRFHNRFNDIHVCPFIYTYVHIYTYIYDFTSNSYLIFGLVMPFSAIDPSYSPGRGLVSLRHQTPTWTNFDSSSVAVLFHYQQAMDSKCECHNSRDLSSTRRHCKFSQFFCRTSYVAPVGGDISCVACTPQGILKNCAGWLH